MNDFLYEVEENNFIFPDYKNSNLSIIKDIASRKKSTGKKKKKIFMLVDGLGYNLLSKTLTERKIDFIKNYKIEKISTVFPSTTVVALTSIETGLTPSEHGMVGWRIYSKELGTVVAPYKDSPALYEKNKFNRVNVQNIIPKPKLLVKMAEDRNVMILLERTIENSPFNRSSNITIDRYIMQSDMILNLKNEVIKDKYDFIYVYYSLIDSIEHKYGPISDASINATALLLNELENVLLPALEESDYNLIITADHGQTNVNKWLTIGNKSKIMNYLSDPPWGDARIMFANVPPKYENDFKEYVAKKYSKYIILKDSDEVISTGIFGKSKIDEKIRYRFGTHILIAKNNIALEYSYPNINQSNKKPIGIHSGLLENEMSVPLVVI